MDYSIKNVAGDKALITDEIVETKNSGTVSVTLLEPKVVTSKVIIITPGFAATMENSSKNLLVPMFISADIACLSFDLYGHGKSSGNIFELTTTLVVEEFSTVINFLKSKGYKDIAVYASSFPALPAAISVAKNQADIKLLILQSPILDIEDYASKLTDQSWEKNGYILHRGTVGHSIGEVKLGYSYYLDAQKYKDTSKYLPLIKAKTLVLLGANDKTMSIKKLEKEALKIRDHNIVTFPKSDHVMTEEKKELYKTVFEFVLKNL